MSNSSINLKIALVQFNIIWEDPESNLAKLNSLFGNHLKDCQLVVLPETFTTGFSMQVEKHAEQLHDKTSEQLKTWSKQYNAHFTGSIIITENNKYYNRLLWVSPDHKVSFYNKRHLFSMGMEDKYYSKGTTRLITNLNGWNICPLICYDLRFPVWSRNFGTKYDLLIYVANWPAARQHVWDTLLKARAIENQCYVIGVNRTGIDSNGIEYVGKSKVINPKGEIIKELRNEEGILDIELNLNELTLFREKFPVLKDADEYEIKMGKTNM